MLRLSVSLLSRRFRYNLKYPALVSYNKLPWEVLTPDSPALHMHAAPHYEQLLTFAATSIVPRFVLPRHVSLAPDQRLRLLPGMVYAMNGFSLPEGFTLAERSNDGAKQNASSDWTAPNDGAGLCAHAGALTDSVSLQYYGRLHCSIAPIVCVRLLPSQDGRLLCNCVTLRCAVHVCVAPHASLAPLATPTDGVWTLYHFFRPNRPPRELGLERYSVHCPHTALLSPFAHSKEESGSHAAVGWKPRLQAPKRQKGRTAPIPFRPPQSYLMGLAERLGVVPGSAFGRRSLMWGHWF